MRRLRAVPQHQEAARQRRAAAAVCRRGSQVTVAACGRQGGWAGPVYLGAGRCPNGQRELGRACPGAGTQVAHSACRGLSQGRAHHCPCLRGASHRHCRERGDVAWADPGFAAQRGGPDVCQRRRGHPGVSARQQALCFRRPRSYRCLGALVCRARAGFPWLRHARDVRHRLASQRSVQHVRRLCARGQPCALCGLHRAAIWRGRRGCSDGRR